MDFEWDEMIEAINENWSPRCGIDTTLDGEIVVNSSEEANTIANFLELLTGKRICTSIEYPATWLVYPD